MADFQKAIGYVFVNEGSEYTDDPGDGGGPTKYGITLADLSRWRIMHYQQAATAQDVEDLTEEMAAAVAQEFYWNVLRLSEVTNQSIATAIMDMAFNSGNEQGTKFAQRAVGVTDDGDLGSDTLAALNGADPVNFFYQFVHEVQQFYVDIVLNNSSQMKFLNGWLNRSQRLITLL